MCGTRSQRSVPCPTYLNVLHNLMAFRWRMSPIPRPAAVAALSGVRGRNFVALGSAPRSRSKGGWHRVGRVRCRPGAAGGPARAPPPRTKWPAFASSQSSKKERFLYRNRFARGQNDRSCNAKLSSIRGCAAEKPTITCPAMARPTIFDLPCFRLRDYADVWTVAQM